MKIFILDKSKLVKFNLTQKNGDTFVFSYKPLGVKKECLITFEYFDQNWCLKSNGIVDVIDDNQIVDQVKLEPYRNYNIKFLDRQDCLILYTLPLTNEKNYQLSCNLPKIIIGDARDCNICYTSHLIKDLKIEIVTNQNVSSIKVLKNPTPFQLYINEEQWNFKLLELGDIIFIAGLKIIWMKNFIIMNNPNNQVFVSNLNHFKPLELPDIKLAEVSESEKQLDLYSEDDYFYHTPRIKDFIHEEDVIIDAPPPPDKQNNTPFIVSMGTSIVMMASVFTMGYSVVMSIITGSQSLLQLLPQLVMLVAMIFGSLILPRIASSYEKKEKKKRENLRQTKYTEYILSKEREIQLIIKKQEQVLHDTFFSTERCINILKTKNRHFWCREYNDEDFLTVRFGIGDVPALVRVTAPQRTFSLDSDNLLEKVYEVVANNKNLKSVPVTLSLKDNKVVSFVFECDYKYDYIKNILLQLVTLHSPMDLRIVIFTDEENKKYWNFMKYITHCWSEDNSIRFFSSTKDSSKSISNYFDELLKKMVKESESKGGNSKSQKKEVSEEYRTPYYLIITDDYKSIKDLPIVNAIMNSKIDGLPFSLLAIDNYFKNVPSRSNAFVTIGNESGAIIEKEKGLSMHLMFKNEYVANIDMRPVCNNLSNIPITPKNSATSLPTALTFLEMYEVSKIEQLNILNRWHDNDPVTSLNCPIGINKQGELFNLNLHEKYHGPHGLVAGMTGSGKSEFIMTYILSMAVNYHPYEVQFVLIDYKGGGLAGAFINKETGVKIPHLTGTITNLDTGEMNRTLVSINSELKRRQRLFNEVRDSLGEGTVDIYKYQKLFRNGIVKEPLAHLFIISDEFAELKAQQPDFMDELVSTARIGRSLGIHLILATQKPSGVVDDQIWSNSKFKICLKVQDASDSNEMLRNSDAASIKEAGRFYLQVGYNDFYDIGQSGWAGAKYLPSDRIVRKVDESLVFIDDIGNEVRSTKKIEAPVKEKNDAKDQLSSIVKYIYDLGKKENIVTKNLWLDAIPSELNLTEVNRKYNHTYQPYNIVSSIGEYDDPASQKQGLAYIDFTKNGNLAIIGQNGSGKEHLLNTIIWSMITEHTPDEVNLYMLDYGAEALKMFNSIPHVGEIITVEDGEKNEDLFGFIFNQLEIRKNLFSEYAGSYKDYCENSGKKLPLIITIINNYDVFSETNSKLADNIETLYRDGVKYGILFILTAITNSSIRSRLLENFENKICLQLPSDYDYQDLMGCDKSKIPSRFFGRGLIKMDENVFEFQTASFADKKDVTNVVRAAAQKMNEHYTVSAKKIPTIPKEITYEVLKSDVKDLNQLPIGYNLNTKEILYFSLLKNRIFPILTASMDDVKMSFIYSLVLMLKQLNTKVTVVDSVGAYAKQTPGINIIKDAFDNNMVNIYNDVIKNANSNETNVYIFLGISNLCFTLSEQIQPILTNLFSNKSSINNSYFIFVDISSDFENMVERQDWAKENLIRDNGIWLGNSIRSQEFFMIKKLLEDDGYLDFEGLAYFINNGRYKIFRQVIDEIEVEDEE